MIQISALSHLHREDAKWIYRCHISKLIFFFFFPSDLACVLDSFLWNQLLCEQMPLEETIFSSINFIFRIRLREKYN